MGLKYRGGPLLEKIGIEALSELEIDADKDWQGKGITSLAQVAPGMVYGDLFVHNGTTLVPLPPGTIGQALMSRGPGMLPLWLDGFLPVAFPLPATAVTDVSATIAARVGHDAGELCDGRLRWREVGAPGWTEEAWQNNLSTGDTFDNNLAGLASDTEHEFQCQMRHDYGTGEWSHSEYFTTLP